MRFLGSRGSRLLALALVPLMLTACGEDEADSASEPALGSEAPLFDKLPKEYQDAGSIKVGADIAYAPMEYYDTDGKTPIGVDIELADALEKQIGVNLEFEHSTFASLITNLKTGRTDLIWSAMVDNAERQKQIDYVDYMRTGTKMVVKKGNPEKISTIEDLCGKTVAFLKGTTQDVLANQTTKDCVASGQPPMELLSFDNDSQGLLQVKQGRATANLNDFAVADYAAKTSGGGNDFEVAGELIPASGPYGIGVAKENTELRDVMQEAVQAMMDNGEYLAVLEKYGIAEAALDTATVNAGQ